jgi:hypothetical protein
MNERNLPRRTFLTHAGWCMGSAALSSAIPASVCATAPGACHVNAAACPDACGDWTVDHVCGTWPPYSFDTGPARPHTMPPPPATPADAYWVM